MLEIIRSLCRNVTGSRCSTPRLSTWSLVDPSQTSIGVDVADVGTGGAAVVIPGNVKIYGSHFSVGLENSQASGGMCAQLKGYGVGGGVGLGWGIPFAGAKGLGRLPDGIKKSVLTAVGGAAQGQAIDALKNAVWSGESGGTRIVSGPDARGGNLSIHDYDDAFGTVVGLGANFVVNGVSLGMLIIAKQRPVVRKSDLIYARAFGLIGGVGLATSLDIEASQIVYRVTVQ